MINRDTLINLQSEAFTEDSFWETHLSGWNGLIRLLVFLNVLGLMGIWVTSARAENVGSELLLLPMEINVGENNDQKTPPLIASLLSTKIDSVISGHIVRTVVTQNFANPTSQWMEGVYYFPLPDDAVVDSMILKIGDRRIISQIQEKSQAKTNYIKAAAAGKRAALLNQYRPNVFSTKVANIEPGEEISVEISFQTLASQKGTEFSWRMPQAITPRYSPNSSQIVSFLNDEFPTLARNIDYSKEGTQNLSAFGIVIKQGAKLSDIQSPSHHITTKEIGEQDLFVELAEKQVPADRDFVLQWQFEQTDAPTALLFQERVEEATYTLGLVLPPKQGAMANDTPRDVTFIMDVSGSMEGIAIDQGKLAMISALDLLKPADQFDIIVFNDQFFRLFGLSQRASIQNIEHAKKFVDRLNANNGTEMYPALKSALEDQNKAGYQRQILFLTDGAVSNENEMFELVASKLGNARLFTVGLGSAPNGWFMRKSAEFGRGMHVEISDLRRTKAELESLFKDMSMPNLEQINIGLGAAADTYPKIIPDLYGNRPLLFITRHHRAIQKPVINGVSHANGPHEIPLSMVIYKKSAGISKLWANKKIEGLTDSLARGMDPEIVKSMVLDVALKHQVMSPYTSFVAIDDTPARVQNDFLNKMKISGNLPSGMAWKKINGPQTASLVTQYTWTGLGLLLLCMFIAWVIRSKGTEQ
ncbi:MAG: marine proteobacterial sortase target protein [Sneathiella sp.]